MTVKRAQGLGYQINDIISSWYELDIYFYVIAISTTNIQLIPIVNKIEEKDKVHILFYFTKLSYSLSPGAFYSQSKISAFLVPGFLWQ